MIWENFSLITTNCAILTSFIRSDPRTCRGFSRDSLADFQSDGRE